MTISSRHASAAAALLTLVMTPACGLITAPASVPSAKSLNVPIRVRGSVVDQDGKPLQDVRVDMNQSRMVWDPAFVISSATHSRTLHVDTPFNITAVAHSIALTFTKEGYYPNVMWAEPTCTWNPNSAVDDRSLPENFAEYPFRRSTGGTFTDARTIPGLTLKRNDDPASLDHVVVSLQKHGEFTTLIPATSIVLTRSDESGRVARWDKNRLTEEKVPHTKDAGPGAISIEATRDQHGRFITVPVPNYGDRITPQRAKLAITGPGNGFILKELSPLPSIERQLNEAPADGYTDAVFPQQELERLLRLPENRAWFFVRINGSYGRGCIQTFTVVSHPDKDGRPAPTAIGLELFLWMQPNGSRNLETAP